MGRSVHLNGRVYDPLVGRFISADPEIQDPTHSQSYNRYTYVWNNPTNFTDPSGFETKQDSVTQAIKDGTARTKLADGTIVGLKGTFDEKGNLVSLTVTLPGDSTNKVLSFHGISAGAAVSVTLTQGGASAASSGKVINSSGYAVTSMMGLGETENFNPNPQDQGGPNKELLTATVATAAGGGLIVSSLGRIALISFDLGTIPLNDVPAPLGGGIAAKEMTTVGRWMSKEELALMKATGKVQEGAGGATFVATSGPESFVKQAPAGSVYVEFKVPTNSMLKGGKEDWFKLIGPNSPKSMQFMLQKQGGEFLPSFENMTEIRTK